MSRKRRQFYRKHTKKVLGAIAAVILVLTAPYTLSGGVRVIDGDTIHVDDAKIRLWGIDAPELSQTCERDGRQYACGQEARAFLAALVKKEGLSCAPADTDTYGRIVARCKIGETDIARAMVQAGWAMDYSRYSQAFYLPAQMEAKKDRVGIWAGTFENPQKFRHSQKAPR